jgi:hypothetical protein
LLFVVVWSLQPAPPAIEAGDFFRTWQQNSTKAMQALYVEEPHRLKGRCRIAKMTAHQYRLYWPVIGTDGTISWAIGDPRGFIKVAPKGGEMPVEEPPPGSELEFEGSIESIGATGVLVTKAQVRVIRPETKSSQD